MTPEMIAIVSSGIRWSSNILIELTRNYGRHMPVEVRTALTAATTQLSEASFALQGIKV